MNGPSTNINDVVNDNKRLSNGMRLDSIINDLNSKHLKHLKKKCHRCTDKA